MRNSNLLTTLQNVRKAPDHANCVLVNIAELCGGYF